MAKKKARKVAAKAKLSPIEPVPAELPAETIAPTPEPTPEPVVETPRRHAGLVGAWAYVIGIVIAAGAAIFIQQGLDLLTYAVLAILGIVVGLLNITEDEILLFLVATVALVISASSLRTVLESVLFMQQFMTNVIIFTAASAFIVSLKALFQIAKNE